MTRCLPLGVGQFDDREDGAIHQYVTTSELSQQALGREVALMDRYLGPV